MKIEGARLLLRERVTVGSTHYDARLTKALKLDGLTSTSTSVQGQNDGAPGPAGRGNTRRGRGGRGQA